MELYNIISDTVQEDQLDDLLQVLIALEKSQVIYVNVIQRTRLDRNCEYTLFAQIYDTDCGLYCDEAGNAFYGSGIGYTCMDAHCHTLVKYNPYEANDPHIKRDFLK